MHRDIHATCRREGAPRRAKVSLRTTVVLPTLVALLCTALFAFPVSAAQQTYTYTGLWLGYPQTLGFLARTSVVGLPDAKFVGQITNFQSTSPKASCLNGLSINVYTAQAEYPNAYVADDSAQGKVCATGAWLFQIYSYGASWLGYPRYWLTLVPNVEVENFADARVAGAVTNFITADPDFSCMNGLAFYVYTASAEFPGRYVVHAQTGTCTGFADTWTFPIYSYTGSWNGQTYGLTLVQNSNVQNQADAKQVTFGSNCGGSGQPGCGSPVRLQSFQTNDPDFSCLNGGPIDVWMAPAEFQAKHVAQVVPGTKCTSFVGVTWTWSPITHYQITFKSFIPQSQLWDPDTSIICSFLIYGFFTALAGNTCPYLTYTAENRVFGADSTDPGAVNCYTPLDPVNTSVSGVLSGDGHSTYPGTYRTQTTVDFDWDSASRTISNFATTSELHGWSSVTLTYYWFGLQVGGPCTVYSNQGLHSPPSGMTSSTTFTTGTSGYDPFIPGENNPGNCILLYCGPYNNVIDATLNGTFNSDGSLSLGWISDWYPNYGIQVWANPAYDAPQYSSTVLDESWVNTMSLTGMTYVGFALKYYNAVTQSCTPTPDPTGLIIPMKYCISSSVWVPAAP